MFFLSPILIKELLGASRRRGVGENKRRRESIVFLHRRRGETNDSDEHAKEESAYKQHKTNFDYRIPRQK
jgi:hypothetical protein